MKDIYIIDASNYIFRSYYAIRNMSTSKGVATNALYGFIRAVLKIQKDFSPQYLVVVFDGPRNKASRVAIYPDYKGNRAKAPDDLYPQIAFARQFCLAANIAIVEVDGVEADDAMGAVARFAKKNHIRSYLCSSDKDLCQLVDSQTYILYTNKDSQVFKSEDIVNKYGVSPNQFVDYLAIVGDASDNIPGISGLGPKNAAKLLQEFGTLSNLIENISSLPNKKLAEKIRLEQANAEISFKLATIDTNLNIPQELSFYENRKPDLQTLDAYYEQMELRSLRTAQSPQKKALETHTLIGDLKALKALVQSLLIEKSICIHAQTVGEGPIGAELVGLSLGVRRGVSFYIPFNGAMEKEVIIKELEELFSKGIHFFSHNIKPAIHSLLRAGLPIKAIDFDTMLASYILDSSTSAHDLDSLIKKFFGAERVALKALIPKGKDFHSTPLLDACNYCCECVDYTIALKELFEKKILESGFRSLFYDLELPLIPILVSMEERGVFLDAPTLKIYSLELHDKLQSLSKTIYALAGKEFNINSPKQLSVVLFEDLEIGSSSKLKASDGTGVEVLQALEKHHPIIPHILEYRTLEKLRSTYADSLPKEVNSLTKRIHCTFNQLGTVTGRLSSSQPNLQNIPTRTAEGKRIRESFRPEKAGWVYLSLDYSQIELRILAHMSREEALILAFKGDRDIHQDTAAIVFGVPLDQVTSEMRYQAKAVNFGILYGQKSFGLAKELGIDVNEAKAIIDTYFEKYPKVKEFIDYLMQKAKRDKKTVTLLGRERNLPDIDSKNFALRAASERFAVNAPIQGSQADIIKIAMIEIEKMMSTTDLNSYLVLQIHDELIFECPENEVDVCTNIVKGAMEKAYSLLVPLKVDVSVGKNWSKC